MRKQTKLVAVLSAAALLAMGASMTSFAAGWEKDDAGIWHYYDSDDEMVTGEWKKDGGKWFYLDDDGEMATDTWVDDDYYVGEDGAMLINQWKKTMTDDDMDDPDEDGENWYYFGSKGKKTTNSKKINGKTYYFDEDGKMQYGWYENDKNVYYLGGEDDGARTSGWLWLEAPDADDDDEKDAADAVDHDGDKSEDPCDEEGWYYFGSDGKMYKDYKQKKINGKYYFFNEHGQMLYEWINGVKSGVASNAQLDSDDKKASPSEVRYLNQVEEGWRADGWYQIDGADVLGAGDDTDWYYFKDGKAKKAEYTDKTGLIDDTAVIRAKIKVNGKYFCFNEIGQMQTGLQPIGDTETKKLNFYYFDENGYMKTGKVSNVEEENDSFTYYFETKNGGNGKGVTGEKSGYLYWNGKRLEADDDYRLYKVDGKCYLVNNKGKLQKSTSKDYELENKDGQEYRFEIGKSSYEVTAVKAIDGKAVTEEDNVKVEDLSVNLPYIELFDSVVWTNGNKNDVNSTLATYFDDTKAIVGLNPDLSKK
ncbi:glucan-binding protein [Clostridium transplantifaecale]|uniref:glucan-binding protein n=1 Tax=Clostridium transplantifaecale TaxID=2479838 RepID=UPI000F63F7D3|nr:glucan-binding protein [Clostridium transplantifaecale]